MQLTIAGCSDAFSSGGRYHSCYLLDTSAGRLMIDCGATAPLALKRLGASLADVGAIVISHCHGDHFGGLPFLYLDKLFVERSASPLEIMGPPGIEGRVRALMDCLYPGIMDQPRRFDLAFRELAPDVPFQWRGLTIEPYETNHPSGSPSLALSIAEGGRRFAFSGDSGWCDAVFKAGRSADLYLIECSTFSLKTSLHLDYLTLAEKSAEIGAKRYLLTHMGSDVLSARAEIDASRFMLAEDGLIVAI